MNSAEIVAKYEGIFTEFPSVRQSTAVPDGPLFGNGDIGVAVCATQNDYEQALDATQKNLTFRIGKNDFWHATSPSKSGATSSGCKGVATLKMFSVPLQEAVFRARQVLRTADVEIDLENENLHLHVSAYAPYGQNLILLKAKAEKGNIPLRISLTPLEDEDADYSLHTCGNVIRITKEYVREVKWETKAACVCRIPAWEKTDWVLHEGEEIIAAVSVVTNHDAADYLHGIGFHAQHAPGKTAAAASGMVGELLEYLCRLHSVGAGD